MKIGYMRVSKADGSQKFDLQKDALLKEGVEEDNIYSDQISGAKSERPGLTACLKALRPGDTLIVWMLDRLGRNLRHMINIVQELSDKSIGLKVLAGAGSAIDTTTSHGRLIFSIFMALSEYERELIRERTIAGLAAARKRGRNGGRKFVLSKAKVRLAMAAMGQKETVVNDLCKELGVSRQTLYNYVGPNGELRDRGKRLLEQ